MNPGVSPDPGVIRPLSYAPGLSVETEQDPDRRLERITIGLRMGRAVEFSQEEAMRGMQHVDALRRDLIERSVRQLQEEAITALGLNNWRADVRREAQAEERAERRRVLLAIREAVRNADSLAAAALLVQDEIDALGVA